MKEFGTLYVDDKTVSIPRVPTKDGDIQTYSGGQITLGNTVPGKALPWVEAFGGYVLDRTVLANVSWGELDRMGLIYGREVTIDGRIYFCRSLKGGETPENGGEWRQLLNITDSNTTWHWKQMQFWCQEQPFYTKKGRVVRGGSAANCWTGYDESKRYRNVGFRPILIYRGIDITSRPELGVPVTLMTKTGIKLLARVISYDAYDMTIETIGGESTKRAALCSDICRTEAGLALARESVQWIRKK